MGGLFLVANGSWKPSGNVFPEVFKGVSVQGSGCISGRFPEEAHRLRMQAVLAGLERPLLSTSVHVESEQEGALEVPEAAVMMDLFAGAASTLSSTAARGCALCSTPRSPISPVFSTCLG